MIPRRAAADRWEPALSTTSPTLSGPPVGRTAARRDRRGGRHDRRQRPVVRAEPGRRPAAGAGAVRACSSRCSRSRWSPRSRRWRCRRSSPSGSSGPARAGTRAVAEAVGLGLAAAGTMLVVGVLAAPVLDRFLIPRRPDGRGLGGGRGRRDHRAGCAAGHRPGPAGLPPARRDPDRVRGGPGGRRHRRAGRARRRDRRAGRRRRRRAGRDGGRLAAGRAAAAGPRQLAGAASCSSPGRRWPGSTCSPTSTRCWPGTTCRRPSRGCTARARCWPRRRSSCRRRWCWCCCRSWPPRPGRGARSGPGWPCWPGSAC